MRRCRGILSLSMTLALAALLFVLQMVMLRQAEIAREAVLRDRARVAARALALDGIEYARAQARSGRWPRGARRFTSPSLQGHGHFELVLDADGRIHSTGVVDDMATVQRWTEEGALP